jgi:hypothetical protein
MLPGEDRLRRDGFLADLDWSDPETAAAAAAITATPTAAAPSGAASAAVSAATAPASAVPTTAVPTTAVPTLGGELYAGRMCSRGVFLVEDIEGRQADVEDFFLAESNYVTRCSVLRRYILCRADDCRGCAAPER